MCNICIYAYIYTCAYKEKCRYISILVFEDYKIITNYKREQLNLSESNINFMVEFSIVEFS